MNVFLFILSNNIGPLVLIIVIGYFLGKKLALDVKTLSRLIIYALTPSVVFIQTYTSQIDITLLYVLVFAISMPFMFGAIGLLISKIRKFESGKQGAFINSLMFYNSANFGLPLIILVFSGMPYIIGGETPYLAYATTVQSVVLIVQSLTMNTIGYFMASDKTKGFKEAIKHTLSLPVIYAIPAALLLKYLVKYDLTQNPLWTGIAYMKNGLVPVALLALGAQLSNCKLKFANFDALLSNIIRLLGAPFIAFVFIKLLNITGVAAQTLMISTSVPTALNTALIAVERDNHPEFASQIVLGSMLLCPITLTFVVYISRVLFPI